MLVDRRPPLASTPSAGAPAPTRSTLEAGPIGIEGDPLAAAAADANDPAALARAQQLGTGSSAAETHVRGSIRRWATRGLPR
jgi:hypothetical protein